MTPIYFVRYARESTTVYMIDERVWVDCHEPNRGGFWVYEPAYHTLVEARALLEKLKAEGCIWGQAYHAGFKERGFRNGDHPKEPSLEFGTYPAEARNL